MKKFWLFLAVSVLLSGCGTKLEDRSYTYSDPTTKPDKVYLPKGYKLIHSDAFNQSVLMQKEPGVYVCWRYAIDNVTYYYECP